MAATDEEIKEDLEHRDVVTAVRDVMSTNAGQKFFKYLFREFSVAEFPQLGMDGPLLHDNLGYFRAGHAIFQLASEANPSVAGALLAAKEKERYEAAVLEEIQRRQKRG